jgi:hypothetical protein
VWVSQIFWVVGWLTILAYRLVTEIFFSNIYFSTSYSDDFIGASEGLAFWLIVYLYLSPIKQMLVLVSAFLSKNSSQNE